MFDDPRWGDDPCDRRDDDRDRDDEWREPGHRRDLGDAHDHSDDGAFDSRDRDGRERDRDDDALAVGRGPGSHSRGDHSDGDPLHRHDERWPERDRDPREREVDPRDAFMQGLDLPRGRDREIVHDARDREYTLRGSETRTLSTVGAFRVVPARELRDHFDRPAEPRDGDHGAAAARSGFSCYGGSSARISGRGGGGGRGGGRNGGLAEEFWK